VSIAPCDTLKEEKKSNSHPVESFAYGIGGQMSAVPCDTLQQKKKSNSRVLDGLSYTWHKTNKDGSMRYKCKCNRSEENCTASIKVLVDGSVELSGQHTDGCYRKNGKTIVHQEDSLAGGDVTDYMQQWVEERCLSVDHSHKTAKVIWQECVDHISESFGNNFSGLSREQVSKLVHNTRNRSFGTDVISKVERQYGGSKSHAFLQHSAMFSDVKVSQRMMAFSSKELLSLLVYPKVNECVMNFSLLRPNLTLLSNHYHF
jgi:hypothetical protein